jgi:hypothetical protein
MEGPRKIMINLSTVSVSVEIRTADPPKRIHVRSIIAWADEPAQRNLMQTAWNDVH